MQDVVWEKEEMPSEGKGGRLGPFKETRQVPAWRGKVPSCVGKIAWRFLLDTN